VVTHLVERDGQCALQPLHDHTERIAHEDDIDPGLVDQTGHRKVVCGHGNDPRARPLHGPDAWDGDLLGESSSVAAESHFVAQDVASSPTNGKIAIWLSPHYGAPP
jgi:hypothetical protein